MITSENIGEMMELIQAAYGDKAFPEDQMKLSKVVNLWKVMFQDDDPAEVLIAVKDCIATLQFPPKIADIKSRIAQSRMAGQPTELEAWTMVYKAVIDADRIGKAQKLFDALPPIAQELVGIPEQLLDWHSVSGEHLSSVVASNFMRSYKIKAEREASYHALPADIQKVESWKLPKEQEKPQELPEPEFKYDENGRRILNMKVIGFVPPYYTMSAVQKWLEEGVPDLEIRKRIMHWGA